MRKALALLACSLFLTGAVSVKRGPRRIEVPIGAANPATCSVGQLFFNTATTTLQVCSAADTWEDDDDSGITAETNSLETTITGIEDAEIFVGTGTNAGAFVAGLAPCAADEKPEYVPGAPDTFTCEAIGSLLEADITDLTHAIDTGPSPDCTGTSTYQDGEGGCDTVGGDVSGGLDSLQLGTDVVGTGELNDGSDTPSTAQIVATDSVTATQFEYLAPGTCISVAADDFGITADCIDDAQVVNNGLDAGSLADNLDFSGDTSFHIPISATLAAGGGSGGEIGIDTTYDYIEYYDGTETRVIAPYDTKCSGILELADDGSDDDIPLWGNATSGQFRVTGAMCFCTGTCATMASFAIQNQNDSAMNYTSGAPTCHKGTTGVASVAAIDADGLSLVQTGELIEFDTTNSGFSAGDLYTVCIAIKPRDN